MRHLIQIITLYFLLYNDGMMIAEAQIGSEIFDFGTLFDKLPDDFKSFINSVENPFGSRFNPFLTEFAGPGTQNAVIDPDAYRNVSELITSKGYPLEEHTVITKDGYVLSVQRIPYGKNNNTQPGDKEVVLLVHGEIGDAKTWFLLPGDQGLGCILPDAGYDVWMVNNRGNVYSKKNIYYPTRSYKFWNFTLDEISKYDLTAVIDYILNATGKEALHVIGYSRGNTVGFVLLSEVPEYNQKVKLLVALAPIAYVGHFETIVKYLTPFAEEIKLAIDAITQGEFLPINKPARIVIYEFCKVNVEFCEKFLFSIGGEDEEQTNTTRVPIYSAQYPSSSSTKILTHFAQLHLSKEFRRYDYGSALGNQLAYNQLEPPDYNLPQITAPVALFWSTQDIIADPTDVGILRNKLQSLVFDYEVPGDACNHFCFIWAINSFELIYKPLLELLGQY